MKEFSETNGRFRFDVSYRRFSGDEGLSVRVCGPVKGDTQELLRFDCFLKTPHYHTAVYGRNEITPIENEDAATWSLNSLRERFVDYVKEADGDELNQAETAQLSTTLSNVANFAEELIRTEQANA